LPPLQIRPKQNRPTLINIAPTFFVVNNNSYDYITIIIGFDNDILISNNWDKGPVIIYLQGRQKGKGDIHNWLIYLFSFYRQIDFIYSVCLKKSWLPPAWSTRKAVTLPLSIANCLCPPTFWPPLEINNDRSLISIITYQNVVVKTNSNIIITIIIYNKKCWGDID
jgi:hypothetical protein